MKVPMPTAEYSLVPSRNQYPTPDIFDQSENGTGTMEPIVLPMADVTINEGEFKSVKSGNLIAPNINSCLVLVYYYDDGLRCGGHSVILPDESKKRGHEGYQMPLKEIIEELAHRALPKRLFIIGDIGIWNDSWSSIPALNNMKINGKSVSNVAGIGTALGIPASDIEIKQIDPGTHDVTFRPNGTYTIDTH